MFTANDMREELNKESEETEKLIDTWLKEVVLPAIRKSGSSMFDVPEGIKRDTLIYRLEYRGFYASRSGNLSNKVYVEIPPKGE